MLPGKRKAGPALSPRKRPKKAAGKALLGKRRAEVIAGPSLRKKAGKAGGMLSLQEAEAAKSRTFVDEESPFSTGTGLSPGTIWPHHDESDDSDAYESNDERPRGTIRLYRALREDEVPLKEGIKPVAPRNKSRTLAKHVQGGGKSSMVSYTSNKRKAVKWSLEGQTPARPPRVATVDIPATKEMADLSAPETARRAGLGRTGKNFARSSSEVVIKGRLPRKYVTRVEQIVSIGKSEPEPGLRKIRTRVKTGLKKSRAKPRAFQLKPE